MIYRLMQPADMAAIERLCAGQEADGFAARAVERFAGQENTYVAEEGGGIQAAVLAVPVTLQGHAGRYLYPLCSAGEAAQNALLDHVCAVQRERGAAFLAAAPAGGAQLAMYERRGFARAFGLRCLHREVRRNIWSQAEFDTVTARQLCELRQRFWPNSVQLAPEAVAVVLQDLYSRGITIVSSAKGYGVYLRQDDTLYFIELMAESDREAEKLMEAAREKEVIVQKAVITVGAAQPLFLGEGVQAGGGVIRFEGQPFDVSESYMRLMLEK